MSLCLQVSVRHFLRFVFEFFITAYSAYSRWIYLYTSSTCICYPVTFLCIIAMFTDQIVHIDQIVQFDQIDRFDQIVQIDFRVIPKAESVYLSAEFNLHQGILYSDYRSEPLIPGDDTSPPTIPLLTIENTVPPNVCGNVAGVGNCLYRAVCLSISGSEVSFEQIKLLIAESLEEHRRDFVNIGEDAIDDLIEEALTDGAYGEQSHLIAISVRLRIPIYVFNPLWTPPAWATMSTELNPNCASVEVNSYICRYSYLCILLIHIYYRCMANLAFI